MWVVHSCITEQFDHNRNKVRMFGFCLYHRLKVSTVLQPLSFR